MLWGVCQRLRGRFNKQHFPWLWFYLYHKFARTTANISSMFARAHMITGELLRVWEPSSFDLWLQHNGRGGGRHNIFQRLHRSRRCRFVSFKNVSPDTSSLRWISSLTKLLELLWQDPTSTMLSYLCLDGWGHTCFFDSVPTVGIIVHHSIPIPIWVVR